MPSEEEEKFKSYSELLAESERKNAENERKLAEIERKFAENSSKYTCKIFFVVPTIISLSISFIISSSTVERKTACLFLVMVERAA